MYKIVFILILSLVSFLGMSQVASKESKTNSTTLDASIAIGTLGANNFRTTKLSYDKVKGSPFLGEKPLLGFVTLLTDEVTEKVPMQYDIYANQFFYVNEKGEELLLELKKSLAIEMKGEKENYNFKRANPETPNEFYDIIFENDDFVLFNDMEIKFYEGKEQGITKVEPRFSRYDNYFVTKNGDKSKKIKLKKKDVFKLFSEAEVKTMENYLKKNKLKLKKAKDFKQLFSAINQ